MNVNPNNIPLSFQKIIARVNEAFPEDREIQKLFKQCFLNTYQTTIKQDEEGTFVITGDIPAMWLRDSSAQVRPYLILAKEDPNVAKMLKQVIERQWKYILLDPYANAFNQEENGKGHQDDQTTMNPWIWERKYEIDSLCYPIQLTYLYWRATGDQSILNEKLTEVLQMIYNVWKVEQEHEDKSPYSFERENCRVSDTLLREGKGGYSVKTGMTWSGFRPSDDACLYGYLVPANMFAVVALNYAHEMLLEMKEMDLANKMKQLSKEIQTGIESYAKVNHPIFGEMYAYETDGEQNFNLMDDANVPSLLSIPYLGYTDRTDLTYQNTRNFILSRHNPYYYEGTEAEGIGSPHTPDHYIWPIALAIQGMTSTSQTEKKRILELFKKTHGATYYMHEGFDADRPHEFTRSWFAWANSMFSEFILSEIGIYVPGSPLKKETNVEFYS
ncbi:glycoside hydrolase family 125 protein [Alkalihalobacillus sp. 1P02AB]|uniref:glycoside hydrolase family 125 protein n=1 Tax=Alkalihalobacillus sp. 1P02AB TaxID=3132260 RepID=UPI0039A4E2C6